jgi:hypothetical protein
VAQGQVNIARSTFASGRVVELDDATMVPRINTAIWGILIPSRACASGVASVGTNANAKFNQVQNALT